MRNLQFIIIPGIVIGIIGGILLFFAAYNYYPHKNVNINLSGKCYELLDVAYQKYQDLVSIREREMLKMQIDSLEGSGASVPITFSGSSEDVELIIDKFDIDVTDIQTLGDLNTQVDKVIIKGVVSKKVLEQLLDTISSNVTKETMIPMPKIGILPNSGISALESSRISDTIDEFMTTGLKKIISEKNGVKETECRSAIIYNG